MSIERTALAGMCCAVLAACATNADRSGTLSRLDSVEADVEDVYVADSLERAAESYRRYLAETSESKRTPEAMRRLADLQIEQAYGVMGSGDIVELAATGMVAPESAAPTQAIAAAARTGGTSQTTESDEAFEERATRRELLLAKPAADDLILPADAATAGAAGPSQAIATYWEILENYHNYERTDQVLYQLSRAYDEIGEPDKAMEVMDRFVGEHPYSRFADEVYFRRGEYYFVRKRYLDAEDAYGAIIGLGASSDYYELALYKLGWSLYKQELYEQALDRYMAMLDHRLSIGYDFDVQYDEEDEHRLADTFRVISLSFSNLGGPDELDAYFARTGHRSYADKIYANLAEFYFEKLRYEDAASVYKSFFALNPYHKVSPHFGMRVVEIYGEAGFPMLVVEA
jgi:outer membrane protein assembly factor BamD (BamD/ComL family)